MYNIFLFKRGRGIKRYAEYYQTIHLLCFWRSRLPQSSQIFYSFVFVLVDSHQTLDKMYIKSRPNGTGENPALVCMWVRRT
jgi:hypothetical protein